MNVGFSEVNGLSRQSFGMNALELHSMFSNAGWAKFQRNASSKQFVAEGGQNVGEYVKELSSAIRKTNKKRLTPGAAKKKAERFLVNLLNKIDTGKMTSSQATEQSLGIVKEAKNAKLVKMGITPIG